MKSIFIVVPRRKLYIFLILPLILTVTLYILFSNVVSPVFFHRNELYGKTIVVDAGHGGVDGGANNKYILEKDINLDVALRLQKKLEESGAEVIMTRTTDTDLGNYNKINRERYLRDLRARLNIINNSSADIFVSIHTNSNVNNPSTRGMMTYYHSSNPYSRVMAYIFQNIFNNYGFQYQDKEYKSYHLPLEGNYYLLANSKIPGVIVETGFITSKTDLMLLQMLEYREYLSDAIYRGIVNYFLKYQEMLEMEQ